MDLFTKCHEFTAAKELSAIGLYPYFHELQTGQDTEVTMSHRENVLMIGSNNYLGLTSDPRVKQAAIDAVKNMGQAVPAHVSSTEPFDLHTQLEKELAEFMGFESALLFSTGFKATWHHLRHCQQGRLHPLRPAEPRQHLRRLPAFFRQTLKYEHNAYERPERLLKTSVLMWASSPSPTASSAWRRLGQSPRHL